MVNRNERRAKQAVAKKAPPYPNISGTKENCGNCRCSVDIEIHKKIITRLAADELAAGRPAPQQLPPDETICMALPDHAGKKLWGWCRLWGSRNG